MFLFYLGEVTQQLVMKSVRYSDMTTSITTPVTTPVPEAEDDENMSQENSLQQSGKN